MKVAIVCDWLLGVGGAERVVQELHKMYPDAPIYTSQYEKKALKNFPGADIRTTWLQKLPIGIRKFLPVLRSWSFSRLDLSEYDLVLSSSGAEAKGIKTGPSTVHISYIHAPTHYYWARYDQYLKQPGFGVFDPLAQLGLKLLVGPLRNWDLKAAQRPDYVVANSNFSKSKIKEYYGRDAVVIHPPVDVNRFEVKNPIKRNGFLVAGRQTPYKRFDIAIGAINDDQKLIVIGNGPDHMRLKQIAGNGENIEFKTFVDDKQMPSYFQSAEAFIFPGVDDFGITAVEAMAAGTPVIAFKDGGALDYVIPGKTGLFFNEPTSESITKCITNFPASDFDHKEIAKYARNYSPEIFRDKFEQFIDKCLSSES